MPNDARAAVSDTPETDARWEKVLNGVCFPECDSYGHHPECPVCFPDTLMADFARSLERRLREAEAVIADAQKVLQNSCDRDWKDETFAQTVAIAANGLYWRGQRAERAEAALATARREALEEAAKVLESHANMLYSVGGSAAGNEFVNQAHAIRALKGTK